MKIDDLIEREGYDACEGCAYLLREEDSYPLGDHSILVFGLDCSCKQDDDCPRLQAQKEAYKHAAH